MRKYLSVLLAIAVMLSVLSGTALFTASAADKIPTGDATVTVINDSSSTPVMTVKSGGLNLLGVQDTVVEDGMTKVVVAGYNGGDPVSQMWITPPEDYSDFSEVSAIQMYVKNTSSEPFAWTWVRVGDDTNCESTVMYIQKDGQWVKATSMKLDANTNDYVDTDGTTWAKIWADGTMVVPGNYDGLIRIELNTTHYKNNAPQLLNPLSAIALSIVVPSDTKPTIWLDDLAIVNERVATEVTGNWQSVEYTFFNFTYGEDGTITAGDSIGGANLNKMLYTFDEELDLYNVESINFYVNNTSGLPLAFEWVAVKAAITSNNNEGIIDTDIEFWNSHPNCLWALNHDCGKYPVQVKADGSDEWTNADTTAPRENGGSVLTIPADFSGYVRIPLSPNEQAYDDGSHRMSKGMGLMFAAGYTDGSGTPGKDDYAGKSFVLKDITAVRSAEGISGSWQSVEYKFYGLTYGVDGTITTGSSVGTNLEKMLYSFDEEIDLYYVEDLHFHVNNTTGLPLAFDWVAAKAAITTNNNEGIIDTDIEFWNSHPNCLWALAHDYGNYPVQVKADGSEEWIDADTTPYRENGGSVLTIPAGFSGDVRIPLSDNERSYSDGSHRYSKGMALMLAVGYTDGSGTPALSEYANKSFSITDVDATVNKLANLYPSPAAPEGLGATDCTTADNNDGTITGVNDTMEYRISGGEWTAVAAEATTVTGLANGTYEVRVKEALPYPAGNVASVKINAWVNPEAQDYVKVVEDFEDVTATADIIKGIEYTFLGGNDWYPCENTANDSAGVKQIMFGSTDNPFQKTLISTALGNTSNADFVQVYMKWNGETDFEIYGQIGASASTPSWYHWMEDNVDGWTGEEDPSLFWKKYIIINGNTGALVGVSGSVFDVFIQDADGAWVQTEVGTQGGIIPAGYEGYVRFAIPEICKLEDLPFGFGWQLYDPSKGEIDGTLIVDDVALVTRSLTPVDGAYTFDEYVALKGEGFDPDSVPEVPENPNQGGNEGGNGSGNQNTDMEFGFDDDDENQGNNGSNSGEEVGADTGYETAVYSVIVMMLIGAALMVVFRKRSVRE